MIEGMTSEIITLRDELNSVKDQRDNALQEVLILKQVSTFYKQKDEQEAKDIEDKLFTQSQLLKKKDNIIHRLTLQAEDLQRALVEKHPKTVVIDRYVLEPNQWNMRF